MILVKMFLYSICNRSVACMKIINLHMCTKVNKTYQILDDMMHNSKHLLPEDGNTTNEKWKSFRECMITKHEETAVDFNILTLLRHKIGPNAGIAYYRYLKNNDYNPDVFTTIKYLELYRWKCNDITEVDKIDILSIYNDFMNKYQTFDLNMTNGLLTALCKINKWEEALKVVERYEKNDKLIIYGYNSLISCLFHCGQDKLGYKYLVYTMEKNYTVIDDVYLKYLAYCTKDKSTFSKKIQKIFMLWSKYGIKPSQNVAFEYMIACNNHGWVACEANVIRSICSVCHQNISEMYLSNDNYAELLQTTKQFLLNNMYIATAPQEITEFINFIEKCKPYDIVLDTLNLLYTNHHKKQYLDVILKKLTMKRQKILLIGRKHISSYLKKCSIQYNTDYYTLHNWSNDDAFILYAAFSSGRNVKLFSNDFLRNAFLSENIELNVMLKKWQLLHQYIFNKNQSWSKLYSQKSVDSVVVKQENNWHIPYLPTTATVRHKQSSDWICIKMCQ